MELALNISTSINNSKAVSKQQHVNFFSIEFMNRDLSVNLLQVKPKLFPIAKKRKSNIEGFDFNFVKNEKVKAIVARKRPAQVLAAKKSAAATKSLVASFSTRSAEKPSNDTERKQNTNAKSAVKVEEKKNVNVDSLLNVAKVKRPEDEASLSLNIDTSVDFKRISAVKLPFGDKKKKLSRHEREERVMQRRIEAAHSKSAKKTSNANAQKSQPAARFAKRPENLFKDNPEVPVVGQRFVKPLNEIVFTGLPMD